MLTAKFDEALLFATEKHRAQVRKGSGVTYVSHLLGVASLVLEHGGDEDEAIGALLHDVIEDQGVSEDELNTKFGPRVAEIVVGCTDGVPDEITGQKPPWKQRKEAYIAHIDGFVSRFDSFGFDSRQIAQYPQHNHRLPHHRRRIMVAFFRRARNHLVLSRVSRSIFQCCLRR